MSTKQSSDLVETRPKSDALSQAETVVSTRSLSCSANQDQAYSSEQKIPDVHIGSTKPSPPQSIVALHVDQLLTDKTTPVQIDLAYPSNRPVSVSGSKEVKTRTSKTPGRPIRPPGVSFFDSDSDSSEDGSPIVERASSVRVITPRVVQFNSGVNARTEKHNDDHQQIDSQQPLNVVSEFLPSVRDTPITLSNGTTVAEFLNEASIQSASTTPDTPAYSQPTASPRPGKRSSMRVVADELSSGSINEREKPQAHEPDAVSSVPDNGRRVRIRPSDLIIRHSKEGSGFRETVVTTPYPPGIEPSEPESDANQTDAQLDTLRSHTVTSPRIVKPVPPSNDCPSSEDSKTLLLQLGLGNHPTVRTTISIDVPELAIFDDEVLFREIKSSYSRYLLGWSRFPFRLIRYISDSTLDMSSLNGQSTQKYNKLDSIEFIRHLSDPRLGRKRRTWVRWLQTYNRVEISHTDRTLDNRFSLEPKRPSNLQAAEKRPSISSSTPSTTSTSSTDFKFLGPLNINRMPFFRDRMSGVANNTKNASHLDPEKGISVQISPRSKSNTKTNLTCTANPRPTHSWPLTSAPQTPISSIPSHPSSECGARNPTIILHHSFNFWFQAALLSLTIILAIAATILWILFGAVGHGGRETGKAGPGVGLLPVEGMGGGGDLELLGRQVAAQQRVLTGLVLGMVVFVLGSAVQGIIAFGGMVLL